MLKFVFLSIRFSSRFFPLKKGSSQLFFTVKQILLKIKSWQAEKPAKKERNGSFSI